MFNRPNFRLACAIALAAFKVLCASHADRGDDILPLIQADALETHIFALQENIKRGRTDFAYRTRSAHNSEASDNAAEYIASQYRRSPRLEVKFEEVGGMKNVVATLPARPESGSDRIFILCAHYDSKADRDRDWNPLTSEAPGADDNATGVAAMLEIAHVLSQFDYDYELRFIAFAGKEVGLVGSKFHAQKASETGEDIAAVLNIDMIGFNWIKNRVVIIQDNSSQWIGDTTLLVNRWYALGMEIVGAGVTPVEKGDHTSFWGNDYHAMTLSESEIPRLDSEGYRANPFYHTSEDTIQTVNVDLVRRVTQLALLTLNCLASMPYEINDTLPHVTVDPQTLVRQNPVQITGQFETLFPIYIVVQPGNISAQIDRTNNTYSVTVPLRTGTNRIRVSAIHALSARSVEQTIVYEPDFEWESVLVYPNPSRNKDELVVFRAEANLPIEQMKVYVHSSDGMLVRRITGAVDRADSRIWRAWWNRKIVYNLPVASGVYVCRFEIIVKGNTYTRHRKLAIVQ
ncbi:MAG: M28 family peptidase [Candidatus Poribacteria bacterium]|nr:M28 family peptidase [Candidatus Poribacteria bacterium]MDE0506359.1 M28 family peptidase [Candidatus Poribacteria bacterium]